MKFFNFTLDNPFQNEAIPVMEQYNALLHDSMTTELTLWFYIATLAGIIVILLVAFIMLYIAMNRYRNECKRYNDYCVPTR